MENTNKRFIYVFLLIGVVMTSLVLSRPYWGGSSSAYDFIEPASGGYANLHREPRDNDSYYYYLP